MFKKVKQLENNIDKIFFQKERILLISQHESKWQLKIYNSNLTEKLYTINDCHLEQTFQVNNDFFVLGASKNETIFKFDIKNYQFKEYLTLENCSISTYPIQKNLILFQRKGENGFFDILSTELLDVASRQIVFKLKTSSYSFFLDNQNIIFFASDFSKPELNLLSCYELKSSKVLWQFDFNTIKETFKLDHLTISFLGVWKKLLFISTSAMTIAFDRKQESELKFGQKLRAKQLFRRKKGIFFL